MPYVMGGQVNKLREPTSGGKLGKKHIFHCEVKRMIATLPKRKHPSSLVSNIRKYCLLGESTWCTSGNVLEHSLPEILITIFNIHLHKLHQWCVQATVWPPLNNLCPNCACLFDQFHLSINTTVSFCTVLKCWNLSFTPSGLI